MSTMLLRNCRLIDGSGSPSIGNAAVVIDGGRITAAGEEAAIQTPTPDVEIDMRGWTIMPALANMHVHLALKLPFPERRIDVERPGELALRCYRKACAALNAGVTTIRSTGDPKMSAIDLKEAINSKTLPGPRIFAAGNTIIATGGHGHNGVNSIEADGPYAFRRAAREQIKLGADLIKICITGGIGTPGEGVDTSQVTPDELSAAVDIAHKFGKHLCVHAGGTSPIRMAIEVGTDCIEHGYIFDEDTARLMAERGTHLVPTLVVTHGLDYMIKHGCRPWMLEKTKLARDAHVQSIKMAYAHGVRICNGTDMLPDDEVAGTIATVREAELMVQSIGMTASEAIVASTKTPAELLGIDGWSGTASPGKVADLIAMPDDPSLDITALRGISFVMKDGEIYRSELPGHERAGLLQ